MVLYSQLHAVPSFDALPNELKQEIFSYFNRDKRSLFAAIRVNKAWYHDCIGMLWRKSKPRRLAKALTQERRQHYANMVYRWVLVDKRSCELVDGLSFPLLKDLSFTNNCLSIPQLRRYSQAALHTLRPLRCKFDTEMLEAAASCCTQLQTLIIAYPRTDDTTPDQFVTFLQSFPALRRLRLDCIENSIMNRVFEGEGSFVAQLEELSWTEQWTAGLDFVLRNKFLKRCIGLRELYLVLEDTFSTDALIQLSDLP